MDCCLIITLILIILIIFSIYNNCKKIDENFNTLQVDQVFRNYITGGGGYVNTGLNTANFFRNIIPLGQCTNNQFFIYNEIEGNKYYLKKESGNLKFERIENNDQYRTDTLDSTFKFTIVNINHNGNKYFGIDLRGINSQILKNNFMRAFIFKQNMESQRSDQIKYYIQSYNYGNFLMNKITTNSPNNIYNSQNLDLFIYRPEDLCDGTGFGEENEGLKYKYSIGIETQEPNNRDKSILRSDSSICPEDFPYSTNEKSEVTDSEFNYEYQQVKQRSLCSNEQVMAPYYDESSGTTIPCDDPPCKSFTVPKGKCYINTPNQNNSKTVHIKDPTNMGLSTLPQLELDDGSLITEEEIENRKLFNIVCACNTGNIAVDGNLQACVAV